MDLTDKKLCAEHLDILKRRLDRPAAAAGAPPPDVPLVKAAADCSVQIAVLRIASGNTATAAPGAGSPVINLFPAFFTSTSSAGPARPQQRWNWPSRGSP
ncbi:MAG: hypothetical protein U5J82_00440 [Desulfobacterales bacterium]|nr:hypothetical protein [Desulfobacterales bacterium]